MFICNHCDKEFASSPALRGHSRLHSKSKGKLYQPMCCCVLTKKVIQAKHLARFQQNLKHCKHCNKILDSNRKFCDHSCAASFNNIARIKHGYHITESHRKKTSKTLKETYIKNGHIPVTKRNKIVYSKEPIICGPYSKMFSLQCKHCDLRFISRKKIKYCVSCKSKYSESAKNGYKFTFTVYDYPDLFDLALLQKHGWFAPGGKTGRWNPNGVSRDHRVSVNEAIRNGYDPFYISHPLNCELMLHIDNDKKKHHSSITYEELIKRVNEYEESKLPGLGSNQHITPFGLSE